MKKLLMAVCILVSTSSFAQSVDWDKISGRMAALSDLHFCILMSEGIEVSNGVDGILSTALDCESSIKKARAVDCSNEEINEQIIQSLQKSVLRKLEKCAHERLSNPAQSCTALVEKATKLGLTKKEIDKELGIAKHLILN